MTKENVITAQFGQTMENFAKKAYMDGIIGTYQHNNYTFEIKGEVEYKDFCLTMADWYLQEARRL